MDHEVEDDIDIQGTRGEDAEAMRLKKHGVVEQGTNSLDNGVESFQMAGLQDAVVLRGEVDELVGLFEGGGERFFDEDIDASGKQRGGHGGVLRRGNGHGGGVQAGLGSEQSLHRWVSRDGILRGQSGSAGRIWIDKRYEMQVGVCGGQVVPDAEMIFAEGPAAEDGNPDWKGGRHAGRYLPATVRRQRV